MTTQNKCQKWFAPSNPQNNKFEIAVASLTILLKFKQLQRAFFQAALSSNPLQAGLLLTALL
jgi:hypothetical protein